jgi:predicted dehydrogenase
LENYFVDKYGKIVIGQIGMGHNHGSAKMQTVRKFPELFNVVGIAEPDEKWVKARGNIDAYSGLRMMSIEELLSTKGLDAVLVETDVWNLVPVGQKCIDAGVHIHLDKPAGENIKEYEKLLSDAKSKKLVVQLGYMYRYNPAVKYCFEAVESGMLGEIFEIDAVMSTEHSASYRKWLENFKGGSMYIFGCHLIDLIVKMIGMPDRIVPFLKKTCFDGTQSYDNGFAVLEYEKATATVRTASTEVNGYGRRQLVVCGRKGTIEVKPLENPTILTISLTDFSEAYADRKKTIELPEQTGRYDDMIKDFAKMIRGETENPFTYEHELLIHRATLMACDV